MSDPKSTLERHVLPVTRSKRSSARLAAVQCVYGLEFLPDQAMNPNALVQSFIANNDERPQLPVDEFGVAAKRIDAELMQLLVSGVIDARDNLIDMIDNALPPQKPLSRLEQVLQAILLCGACELLRAPETDSAVIVNEYLNLTHLYYDRAEVGLVNAVLDKVGSILRN